MADNVSDKKIKEELLAKLNDLNYKLYSQAISCMEDSLKSENVNPKTIPSCQRLDNLLSETGYFVSMTYTLIERVKSLMNLFSSENVSENSGGEGEINMESLEKIMETAKQIEENLKREQPPKQKKKKSKEE